MRWTFTGTAYMWLSYADGLEHLGGKLRFPFRRVGHVVEGREELGGLVRRGLRRPVRRFQPALSWKVSG